MKYYASLDENNLVTNVILVSDEDAPNEEIGLQFIASLGLSGTWKETCENGSFRKNYAIIGGVYDSAKDAFIGPKRFASWILDESTCRWKAPIPYPTDGELYSWDEDTTSWVAVSAG